MVRTDISSSAPEKMVNKCKNINEEEHKCTICDRRFHISCGLTQHLRSCQSKDITPTEIVAGQPISERWWSTKEITWQLSLWTKPIYHWFVGTFYIRKKIIPVTFWTSWKTIHRRSNSTSEWVVTRFTNERYCIQGNHDNAVFAS